MVERERLSAFLRDCAARQFKLGEFDCGLWLADWYVIATGKHDPAAHLRGAAYGVDALQDNVEAIVKTLGLEQSRQLRAGDVGILDLPPRMGAIFTGWRWAVLSRRGIAAVAPAPGKIVQAWSLA